jgi:hypothetical protein
MLMCAPGPAARTASAAPASATVTVDAGYSMFLLTQLLRVISYTPLLQLLGWELLERPLPMVSPFVSVPATAPPMLPQRQASLARPAPPVPPSAAPPASKSGEDAFSLPGASSESPDSAVASSVDGLEAAPAAEPTAVAAEATMPDALSPRLASATERINQRIRAMSVGTGKSAVLVDDRVRVITTPLARDSTSAVAVTDVASPLPPPRPRDSKSLGVATCKDVLLWLASLDNERLATCALVCSPRFS